MCRWDLAVQTLMSKVSTIGCLITIGRLYRAESSWCSIQYRGSGSALIWLSWIRIRIGNGDPDPERRNSTKIKKLTWFPACQHGFCIHVQCCGFGFIESESRSSSGLSSESGSGSRVLAIYRRYNVNNWPPGSGSGSGLRVRGSESISGSERNIYRSTTLDLVVLSPPTPQHFRQEEEKKKFYFKHWKEKRLW